MSGTKANYLKFGAAIAAVLLAVSYLAYTGVQENKSYYKTIRELRSMGDGAYALRLRVAGNVQPGSIHRSGTHVDFDLVENDQILHVAYTGSEPPPDTFKDNAQAMASGRFERDGVFHASEIQAKCASKYAPQESGKPANGMPASQPAKSMTQLQSGSPARASD